MFLRSFLFLIILITALVGANGPKIGVKQQLMKSFIGDGGSLKKEDKFIPPELTTVTVSLVIYSILGIDSREVMELYGWVKVRWKDSRLKWNPQEWANVSTIFLPRESLWLPDIGIWNSIDSDKIDMMLSKGLTRLEVSSDGSVYAYAHFDSQTPCSVNGLLYPFDRQTCEISLGTITSTKSEYTLAFGKFSPHETQLSSVGEWELINYDVNTTVASDVLGGDKFVYNKIYVHLKRKPLYHILLVILPFSLLSLTAASIFFLENNSDRFNIAVAVLLSMTLYIVIASQNVPKSMQKIPIMGIFLLNQMSLVIIMVFVAVLYPLIKKTFYKRDHEVIQSNRRSSDNRRRVSSSCVFLVLYIVLTLMNGLVFLYIIPSNSS